MARILDLYDQPPADGRVICVGEFGPLNLQPRPGRGWFPTGRPSRLRATYNRAGGVRHMLAALDLASGYFSTGSETAHAGDQRSKGVLKVVADACAAFADRADQGVTMSKFGSGSLR